ncbi:hypothetical protein SISNIDRAFT_481656 [Sistotremastrum niveocremeum HHB9708]|uniref:Uncharacterized protein n=1 Tax=Sistotremastrum niveocremeum HHB9708 TaxID=1314777 RepID=A0A164ZJ13_9AGAM|nr:hypothetical protein SISNIDRAFT_481656 [Sistotremastrum niveocremeum HHB9708]
MPVVSAASAPSSSATMNHLESLVSFYQTEQMWILHAQASLTLASVTPLVVPKTEDTDTSLDALRAPVESTSMPAPPLPPSPSTLSKPLWARRRTNAKLRLANLSTQSQRPGRRTRSDGETLLHQFSSLVDSRIESCQRVAHLIAAAERRRARINPHSDHPLSQPANQ